MASISTDPRGNRSIQFIAGDRRRRTIRLGKASLKDVQSIRFRVELLVVAQRTGQPIDAELASWLARAGDDLYGRLAAVGLVSPRGAAVLGKFMAAYIAEKTDVAQRTTLNLKMAATRLNRFFGESKPMREITPADADRFLIFLKSEDYAEATRARTMKYARQFFNAAIRGRLLTENPFAGISGGSESNDDRQFFVTREMTSLALAKCPDREWRLIIALSRYGGLRCPSEILALKWEDIDWESNRFTARSTKTGTRSVPIFPELRPFLEECFNAAEDGAVNVITRYRSDNTNLRTQFHRILDRAGVPPWERAFHNLRSSRQTELEAEFPSHVVCAWLGNSPATAHKHYLQIRDEDFQRAARAAESGAVALQKQVQAVASNGEHSKAGDARDSVETKENASHSPVLASNGEQSQAVGKKPYYSDQDSNLERRGRSSV